MKSLEIRDTYNILAKIARRPWRLFRAIPVICLQKIGRLASPRKVDGQQVKGVKEI
jgi:hypothetical protein